MISILQNSGLKMGLKGGDGIGFKDGFEVANRGDDRIVNILKIRRRFAGAQQQAANMRLFAPEPLIDAIGTACCLLSISQ